MILMNWSEEMVFILILNNTVYLLFVETMCNEKEKFFDKISFMEF